MHRLVVTDALGRRVVSLDKSPFLIGRVEASDLRLAGSQVSRNHAEVVVRGDEVIVRDSESRYGTFVNGARITEHRLASGDRIRIGGLGILQVRKRAARMGRNPATGEQIKIKASKKVAFRASKELKEAV